MLVRNQSNLLFTNVSTLINGIEVGRQTEETYNRIAWFVGWATLAIACICGIVPYLCCMKTSQCNMVDLLQTKIDGIHASLDDLRLAMQSKVAE